MITTLDFSGRTLGALSPVVDASVVNASVVDASVVDASAANGSTSLPSVAVNI